MKSIEFKEQNVIFAKDQEEYANLPAFAQQNGMVTFCMELDKKELKNIKREPYAKKPKIKITVLNFKKPVQAICVRTAKPEFPISHNLITISNPDSFNDGEGTATFAIELSPEQMDQLNKDKCLWITTVTHGSPLQPISQTIN